MKHIRIPDQREGERRRLPFYLAVEEWVARNFPSGDYFFSWRVDPTVICGRNQEIDKEVNLDYCRKNGIDVVRRRSGGGCVFADRQNFMFSYITASDKVTEVFARYTEMIAAALRSLGIDARASGRNDILIGERKVSGNAFYHIPGKSIAHGTMLYDFDTERLSNAITPSKAKLESKGVKSVPMRVTCLKNEGISLSPEEFESYMLEKITDGEPYLVTLADIEEIRLIEETYYSPSFLKIGAREDLLIEGRRRVSNRENIEGLGEFCVEYDVDSATETISRFSISGDFFMKGDVESRICRAFNGLRCERGEIERIVNSIDPESVVPGLDASTLLRLVLP